MRMRTIIYIFCFLFLFLRTNKKLEIIEDVMAKRVLTPQMREKYSKIVNFWFGTEEPFTFKTFWFASKPEDDEKIKSMFYDDLLEIAAEEEHRRELQLEALGEQFSKIEAKIAERNAKWPTFPWPQEKFESDEEKAQLEADLGKIILFDQFTRNMFRKSAKAFHFDRISLGIACEVVLEDLDLKVSPLQRMFLYLPIMHTEDSRVQDISVKLTASLNFPKNDHFAIEHKEVIEKFGRFPFRNAALGRESTPEEIEFMKTGDGYGQ